MSTATDLAEASAAYHKLLTGRAIVSITVDGEVTQYGQADRAALKSYIETLERKIGTTTGRRRPAGVY